MSSNVNALNSMLDLLDLDAMIRVPSEYISIEIRCPDLVEVIREKSAEDLKKGAIPLDIQRSMWEVPRSVPLLPDPHFDARRRFAATMRDRWHHRG